MFHYNGPSCTSTEPCPDGLHYWFDYAAETQYAFTSVSDIEDTALSCQITRGTNETRKIFFGVNMFVTPPSQSAARTLNTMSFAGNHIKKCSQLNDNDDVNLLFVDFWSEGMLLPELVQEHNKALGSRRLQQKMLRTNP